MQKYEKNARVTNMIINHFIDQTIRKQNTIICNIIQQNNEE